VHSSPGLTVIDTDTRLNTPEAVGASLSRMLSNLRASEFDLVYKKTDSVLRGPVRAEIDFLMHVFARPAALLVAQNPSRGRTIRDGVYRIDEIALAETHFAHDPEYPVATSEAIELLGRSTTLSTRRLDPGDALPLDGINIGEASNLDDVRLWASRTSNRVLPAGGVDFFQMLLEHHGYTIVKPSAVSLSPGITLFVCGSAAASSAHLVARAEAERLPVCPMPDLDSGPAAFDAWWQSVVRALDAAGRALMIIHQPLDRSPGAPERFQTALAGAAARVLATRSVANLLLEGGATAAAICRKMGWNSFDVPGELAPGIAELQPLQSPHQHLFVKPGSYAWPEAVWRTTTAPPSA
jgi:uncharacterized protein YgbK (DUF1537 family)